MPIRSEKKKIMTTNPLLGQDAIIEEFRKVNLESSAALGPRCSAGKKKVSSESYFF